MFTAWDGYARVDYLPEPGRIQVTLLTVEPTVYRRVRPGLACAFAADDAVGPPTFVGMDIGFGLTDDEVVLLGALASVASELMTARSGSRTARLALDEVAELAETWTPYREPVLAESTNDAPARTGVWGSGLWTRLSGLGLAAALVAQSPGHLAGFRSGGRTADGQWSDLALPTDLADAAGVHPDLSWSTYRYRNENTGVEQAGVLVLAHAVGEEPPELVVGFDGAGWTEFVADESVPFGWLAVLPLGVGEDEPALRFRTNRRIDG